MTGWEKGRAQAAALTVFRTWLEERDNATRSEIRISTARTRDYLVKNSSLFSNLSSAATPAANGWRDEGWFYLTKAAWKNIHGSNDTVEAARHHQAGGLLRTQKGGSLQYRMGRKTPGRPNVYAVSASILDEQETRASA